MDDDRKDIDDLLAACEYIVEYNEPNLAESTARGLASVAKQVLEAFTEKAYFRVRGNAGVDVETTDPDDVIRAVQDHVRGIILNAWRGRHEPPACIGCGEHRDTPCGTDDCPLQR